MVHCIYFGVTGKQRYIAFHSLTIIFSPDEMPHSLANSEDSDETPQNVAFHLSLHCMQNYKFRFPSTTLVNEYVDLLVFTRIAGTS